jgi:hypothetical protein
MRSYRPILHRRVHDPAGTGNQPPQNPGQTFSQSSAQLLMKTASACEFVGWCRRMGQSWKLCIPQPRGRRRRCSDTDRWRLRTASYCLALTAPFSVRRHRRLPGSPPVLCRSCQLLLPRAVLWLWLGLRLLVSTVRDSTVDHWPAVPDTRLLGGIYFLCFHAATTITAPSSMPSPIRTSSCTRHLSAR